MRPVRVPLAIRSLVLNSERRLISAVSAAEIAIKQRKYGKNFDFNLSSLAAAFEALNCDELPLTVAHQKAVPGLPKLHEDPFDHLLMSQAITEGIPFVTMDEYIRQYRIDQLTLV